ncbi:MAG: hypothetical protein ACTSWN_13235, partial [Promethearchaeota archaeon]
MTALEKFEGFKDSWTSKNFMINECPTGWTMNDCFHAIYHAMNSQSTRNIKMVLVPDTDSHGNVAVSLFKQEHYYQIEAMADGVEITVWAGDQVKDSIDGLISSYSGKIKKYLSFIGPKKDKKVDIIKSIIIEEKIDEVINNVLNKEKASVVYLSVGKVREFGANIPLLMNAPNANIFQLSLQKWMEETNNLRVANP